MEGKWKYLYSSEIFFIYSFVNNHNILPSLKKNPAEIETLLPSEAKQVEVLRTPPKIKY